MWMHRNNFVHKNDTANKATRKREDLQDRIRKCYPTESKTSLLDKDQKLYYLSLEELIAGPDSSLQAWLKSFDTATQERDYVKDSEKNSSSDVLRQWLIRKSTRKKT